MQFSTRGRLLAAFLVSVSAASMAQAGTVDGHVIDSSGTRALESATVRIAELNRSVETARDGGFILADLPAGSYTLEASYVGAASKSQTVDVPAEGTVSLEIALAASSGSETVLVIGQRASQASALSRQKAADGVESVLTRDAIGQFPDQNVAESLRRLPGVNILNDQGEGRFVSVRGLDPELNASSLNGVRLPAPESDIRAVALDVVSSDTIESIEVKKSLTPDMDADTIGASIEIKTTSAFDRRKPLLVGSLEGSYNDYSGKITPKGGVDFATRLGENFGVSGGLSYYKRKFETDNIETGGWKEADGIVFNDETEYRDYDVERTRINAQLGFDLRASDTTDLYLRGNFSQFDDHEYRRRTTLIFDEDPASGDADGAFFTDEDGRIEVRRDLKDRFERQRIRSVVFGGDTDTGVWKANWSASWAKSTEKEDFSLDPLRYRARFDGDGVDIAMDYSDPRIPRYAVTSGASLVNDPDQYSFNRIELTDLSDSQDEEYAVKGDLARTFAMASGTFTVQGGVKSRWRDKSFNGELIYYDDDNDALPLSSVLGTQTYRLLDLGPVLDKYKPAAAFLANRSSFDIDQHESDLGSFPDDYSVQEDILAGYLLGRWDSDQVRLIGGVRVERTWNQLNGSEVFDDGDDVTVTPLSFERSYTDWLPSVTLRYQPMQQLVARFAVSKSLVRPKLSKLAPRFNINEDLELEAGNPDLVPYRAWNFDAGVEYYFGQNAAITGGVFYKTVDNFIVDRTITDNDAGGPDDCDLTYQGITYCELTIGVNGDKADIFGIEASYSQAFTMLPAPFDGLLVQANYTYTDASGTLDDGREIPLPAASKNTFNLTLGYDKGPVDLRVAGTYRSKYLDEVGGAADEDRYVDNHFQVDISFKYRVTRYLRVFADWVNVNNAKYFAYQNFEGAQRLLQFEKYGPTFKFGAKLNF